MKKALIIVDYQNDFVTGVLGFEKAIKLEPLILKKLNKSIENNEDIIFTLDTHDEDYLNTVEGKNLPVIHCKKNTNGHNLFGKVASFQQQAKQIFFKDTFGSLALGIYLQKKRYDIVEICGLVTNMCVLSNAVIAKAALPNAQIIVDSNCVASFDEGLHKKTIEILKSIHIDII